MMVKIPISLNFEIAFDIENTSNTLCLIKPFEHGLNNKTKPKKKKTKEKKRKKKKKNIHILNNPCPNHLDIYDAFVPNEIRT